ncbi:putative transposase, partial [Caldanaerobius fijiensis DSM 17918]
MKLQKSNPDFKQRVIQFKLNPDKRQSIILNSLTYASSKLWNVA